MSELAAAVRAFLSRRNRRSYGTAIAAPTLDVIRHEPLMTLTLSTPLAG